MGNAKTRSIEFLEKDDFERNQCLCIESQVAKVLSGKSSEDLKLRAAIDFAEREEETQQRTSGQTSKVAAQRRHKVVSRARNLRHGVQIRQQTL